MNFSLNTLAYFFLLFSPLRSIQKYLSWLIIYLNFKDITNHFLMNYLMIYLPLILSATTFIPSDIF